MRRASLIALLLAALPASADVAFEKHVRPLLVEHCHGCHGPKKQMGGLRLDSRAALLKGGDSGPALRPGDPDGSLLIQAVRHAGELKMPPRKKLPEPAVAALAAWVKAGAAWPVAVRADADRDAWKRHWAFRPVARPAVPMVNDANWARTPVDRFILAKLEVKRLTPSPEADRRTLIRRLTFDLIGLPPSPEEVETFINDARPGAYERLVDRLLASPHHGERWGRHWLDVARYADTKGYVFFEEAEYPWGWTYRDYVIEALNADLPYDRFLLEQLAADVLPAADRRSLRALGFLALGGRFMNNVHDIIDDRIDVVTRGLMGLTVSCARCHDHKFDPIPTADYYSLHGVFASSTEPAVPPLYEEPRESKLYASFRRELQRREKALNDFLAKKFAAVRGAARSRIGDYLLAAHAKRGQPRGDDFMFIADGGDLNPTLVVRYQAYLEQTARAPHRIWAPWHAYTALPEADFAARARAVSFRPGSLNPHVARLFAAAPASLQEAADRYGRLFAAVDGDRRFADDREELRQVLRGNGVPADVRPGLFSDLELLPDRPAQAELQKLRRAVEQWRVAGVAAPPRANVLLDLPRPVEPVVFRRGNPNNRGEAVPRRLPALLAGERRAPFTQGSGRLELARAIADPNNPLTARVIVNRVWMQHFGRGLVETPGDFGLRAAPPSHPELLDWLADEFVRAGWSLKHLHRLIVTSAAYRQASADRPACRAVDVENTLLWRFPRRHLDLEALRDALLAVGGQLDAARVGGPSVKDAMAPGVRRRTAYSHVDRLHVPGLFRTFDFPTPDASSPQRDRTLVPQQALFLMNSPFALHAARSLATRAEGPGGAEGRVRRMYRLCYGREPAAEELRLAEAFLRGGSPADWPRFAQALLLSNEFVYVD